VRLLAGSLVVATAIAAVSGSGGAQGHGPIFGLSTPTLRRGGWSLDNGFMGHVTEQHEMAMYRPMLSYGVTERVQLSVSVPVPLRSSRGMSTTRMATRMPATMDVEFTLGWRFQAREFGIGSRYESTAYLTLDMPVDETRDGATPRAALAAGLTTGYVSRGLYAWLGGMYHRYVGEEGLAAHGSSDLVMYSAVLGLRPPPMQRDYPQADWRVFVEAVGESSHRNADHATNAGTPRQHQLFAGPTLLGLFGGWGVSGGPLFPVWQRVRGTDREKVRFALDLVFWF